MRGRLPVPVAARFFPGVSSEGIDESGGGKRRSGARERAVAQEMAYERRGEKSYFYSKEKVDGRVVSTYHGAGRKGEIAAGVDAIVRETRRRERAAARAEAARTRREIDDLLGINDEFREAVRATLRAVLIAEGYHEHKREWRRARRSSAG
jgi:hypothetical protein